jgi:hypothetical protein
LYGVPECCKRDLIEPQGCPGLSGVGAVTGGDLTAEICLQATHDHSSAFRHLIRDIAAPSSRSKLVKTRQLDDYITTPTSCLVVVFSAISGLYVIILLRLGCQAHHDLTTTRTEDRAVDHCRCCCSTKCSSSIEGWASRSTMSGYKSQVSKHGRDRDRDREREGDGDRDRHHHSKDRGESRGRDGSRDGRDR